MDSTSAISVHSLQCRYGRRTALDAVTFQAHREIISLIGPNGSGKSTLLKAIGGLVAPSQGMVSLFGSQIQSLGSREIARRVSFVPQHEPIQFQFTSLEVVLMGRIAQSIGLWDTEEDRRVAQAAMEFTDCWTLRSRPVEELSGGERQRVLIARALAQEADIVLMDEPFTHLDVRHQVQTLELLHRLGRESKTVLVAMHDLPMLPSVSPRAILLDEGKVVLDAAVEDVLNANELDRVYSVEFARLRDERGTIVLPRSSGATS